MQSTSTKEKNGLDSSDNLHDNRISGISKTCISKTAPNKVDGRQRGWGMVVYVKETLECEVLDYFDRTFNGIWLEYKLL